MKRAFLAVLMVMIATAAWAVNFVKTDDAATVTPLWGDTLTTVSGQIDTSGTVRIEPGGGYFAVTVWADTIASTGEDSCDLKLEYQLMTRDMKYRTAVAEDDSITHPQPYRVVWENQTWYPVKEEAASWTTIKDGIDLKNERDCYSVQLPLIDGIRFRFTGTTTTCDSVNVKLWLRREP